MQPVKGNPAQEVDSLETHG